MHLGSKRLRTPSPPAGKIPSIEILYDLLGFHSPSLKEMNLFKEAAHLWRKSYKTSDGKPASDLLNWKESLIQQQLTEATDQFLDNDGNGERFWSANRSWIQDSDLQFPGDRERIVDSLKQIFWRQNRYHRNNTRYHYGYNKAIKSTDGPRASTQVRKAVKATLTSLPHGDSQIRPLCTTSTATYEINMDNSNPFMLKPTQASSAPRTEDIQARILAESGASSKRTRADEGPANNPKRRKRQENSSIPWNRHPPSSTGVHQAKRADQADTTTQAELPTGKSLSPQFSPPKRPFIVPIANMTVPESPKDDIGRSAVRDTPISINTKSSYAEDGASLVATRSTLPLLPGQASTTREFDATPDQAPQTQHLVQEAHLSFKPKTRVPIWIVTPGVPLLEELWADGKLLGSTLLAFVEGISKVKQLGHIEKIKLTLRTTFMSVIRDTIITVFTGDEDLWNFAKDAFRDKMKEVMTEAKANNVRACFRILVEPFYEQEEFEF